MWGFDPANPTAIAASDKNDPDMDPPTVTEAILGVEHSFRPELVAINRDPDMQYMTTPTPEAINKPGVADFVRSVGFSIERNAASRRSTVSAVPAQPKSRAATAESR